MTDQGRREFLKSAGLLGLGAAASHAPISSSYADPKSLKIDKSLGRHVCAYDFPELKVGCASYPAGPTGVTVFSFPQRLRTLVDVRGGCPGTIFTDQLREDACFLDSLVFTGGSLYGLEAVSGVSSSLFQTRKSIAWDEIALVSGAVIYDFGMRKTKIFPDKRLAQVAFKSAKSGRFPLGGKGAGAGASCGKWLVGTALPEWSGQGAAFIKKGSTKVAVFSVVNSLGALHDRSGKVVRGHKDPVTGARLKLPKYSGKRSKSGGNTTLTFVLVNHALETSVLRSLARQVHSSMARAIQPFHGLSDGDVLYLATTDAIKKPQHNSYELAAMASDCAWDAVLASFRGRP
ncbi:MAG: P1 family peptidase [Planctomycetota bacterium]|nr:P1 family peptidase [Planctomycetota bacterium]